MDLSRERALDLNWPCIKTGDDDGVQSLAGTCLHHRIKNKLMSYNYICKYAAVLV
jgi:hypothetical protein